MRTGPNIRKRADGRYEARYIKGRTAENRIIYGYCYGHTYEEAEQKRNKILSQRTDSEPDAKTTFESNLLILGAGGHGKVVKEVAEAMGIYARIDFLDDADGNGTVGKIADYINLVGNYKYAFVGIGNNNFRKQMLEKLENAGYEIPTLIHPRAYISPSCSIGGGSVVEPMAVVNAGASVGKGCIISVGSIVDHDSVIEDCVHVNAGAICKAGSFVETCMKLEAGQVIRGY